MIIEKNKVVSLVYELRSKDSEGEVVESLNESNPLTFIFGSGSLLPKFEENINGLKLGDPFTFGLKSHEAYGNVLDEAVVEIPKSVFFVDGELDTEMIQVGNSVPMMDSEGNRLNGVVVSIADETIKMDFNHPLAGENLFFNGKIVDIREATEEEITHGHIHGSHSCGDGGCNSGGCGDSGCGDGAEKSGCCGSC